MRVVHAVVLMALLVGPAYGQTVTPYGEQDKDKTANQIESERRAEQAYRRSLSNVPDAAGSADPWGSVRDNSGKGATKGSAAKNAKPVKPAN